VESGRDMASRQGGSAAKRSLAVKLVGRNRIITRGKEVPCTRVRRRDEARLTSTRSSLINQTGYYLFVC
jgi:hypothetical protein